MHGKVTHKSLLIFALLRLMKMQIAHFVKSSLCSLKICLEIEKVVYFCASHQYEEGYFHFWECWRRWATRWRTSWPWLWGSLQSSFRWPFQPISEEAQWILPWINCTCHHSVKRTPGSSLTIEMQLVILVGVGILEFLMTPWVEEVLNLMELQLELLVYARIIIGNMIIRRTVDLFFANFVHIRDSWLGVWGKKSTGKRSHDLRQCCLQVDCFCWRCMNINVWCHDILSRTNVQWEG